MGGEGSVLWREDRGLLAKNFDSSPVILSFRCNFCGREIGARIGVAAARLLRAAAAAAARLSLGPFPCATEETRPRVVPRAQTRGPPRVATAPSILALEIYIAMFALLPSGRLDAAVPRAAV